MAARQALIGEMRLAGGVSMYLDHKRGTHLYRSGSGGDGSELIGIFLVFMGLGSGGLRLRRYDGV